MIIVGERLNSSRKEIYNAIENRDAAFIRNEAVAQANAGADYLDVNTGLFASKEAEQMAWLIDIVQDATPLPICIDSPNPEVIRHVLPMVEKTPMLNSITLEKKRFETLIPLVIDRSCKVIGLCQNDAKAAHTSLEKTTMASELIAEMKKAGVPEDHIYLDPLVFPLATDTNSAKATFHAVREIHETFPHLHLICGLTNVSYGLPKRKLINRSFLTVAIVMGLDAAIVDPLDKKLMAALKAGVLLNGRDPYARGYIEAYRNGLFEHF
jgi:5-methyltetrahydrofolate--homocysteine methyltransferase